MHFQLSPSQVVSQVVAHVGLTLESSCILATRLLWPRLFPSLRSRGVRDFTQPHRPQSAMLWSASVLSATSSDTEPTIVLNFDTGKYIFNVGENTGRSFMQGRRGWKNAKAIFLTSVGTQRTSGLPGKSFDMYPDQTSHVLHRVVHASSGRVI